MIFRKSKKGKSNKWNKYINYKNYRYIESSEKHLLLPRVFYCFFCSYTIQMGVDEKQFMRNRITALACNNSKTICHHENLKHGSNICPHFLIVPMMSIRISKPYCTHVNFFFDAHLLFKWVPEYACIVLAIYYCFNEQMQRLISALAFFDVDRENILCIITWHFTLLMKLVRCIGRAIN